MQFGEERFLSLMSISGMTSGRKKPQAPSCKQQAGKKALEACSLSVRTHLEKPAAIGIMSVLWIVLTFSTLPLTAQPQEDKVVVQLTTSSDLVFTMRDPNDLKVLRGYDFQGLFDDILDKMETNDSTSASVRDTIPQEPATGARSTDDLIVLEPGDSKDRGDDWSFHYSSDEGRTEESFNIDLGTSNYLLNGKFPDDANAPYAVRPLGSIYVGLNSTLRSRIANKFFLEWGGGVSWYNFKFQQDNIRLIKDDNGVIFFPDTADYKFKKSKLSAAYLTASFVPVLDFSGSVHKSRFWDSQRSFRIGAGPYAAYRLASHSKVMYSIDGNGQKDKLRENPYLSNFRYGIRFQIGFRSTDLFFNYDLNPLFVKGKGPDLQAFSFGIVL